MILGLLPEQRKAINDAHILLSLQAKVVLQVVACVQMKTPFVRLALCVSVCLCAVRAGLQVTEPALSDLRTWNFKERIVSSGPTHTMLFSSRSSWNWIVEGTMIGVGMHNLLTFNALSTETNLYIVRKFYEVLGQYTLHFSMSRIQALPFLHNSLIRQDPVTSSKISDDFFVTVIFDKARQVDVNLRPNATVKELPTVKPDSVL